MSELIKYQCKGCGEYLRETDILPYRDDSFCHTVPHGDGDVDFCGPVEPIEERSDGNG